MATGHKCPDRCHRCPLLNGAVMPGCMGTAGRNVNSLLWCSCRPKSEADRLSKLERRVEELTTEVKRLRESAPRKGD